MGNVRHDILKLPRSLPRSDIVYGEYGQNFDKEADKLRVKGLEPTKECERMFRALCAKYITAGAELELNLSHWTKQRFARRLRDFESIEDSELMHLFDEAIEELLHVMEDAYRRFRMTEGFIQYEKKLKRKQK